MLVVGGYQCVLLAASVLVYAASHRQPFKLNLNLLRDTLAKLVV